MLTRIDHVGIACRDLEETIAFYSAAFGLTVACRETNEEQGVREAMLHLPGTGLPGTGQGAEGAGRGTGVLMGASYIQLLEPARPDSPVGKFLARRGEGIHHVGYGVTDITSALTAIGSRGIRLIDERPRHGSMGASIAFLHPADVGGVLTELVQAPRP
ncbi:MAG TPA: methylmalonyl-CoA epimerase [Streptosporangiaceae bacterium]|nr:methylmalonyl-CoA epimerase [Streptosporangiaceae bacterium]